MIDFAADTYLAAFVFAVGTILLYVANNAMDRFHRPPLLKIVEPMFEPEDVIAVLMFSNWQIERIRDAYCEELGTFEGLNSRKLPPEELVDFARNLKRGPVTIREIQRRPLMAFAERRDLPWLAFELMKTDTHPRFVCQKPPISPELERKLKAFYGDIA
jgi:hypothetical protein